jgi:hypothetical protein
MALRTIESREAMSAVGRSAGLVTSWLPRSRSRVSGPIDSTRWTAPCIARMSRVEGSWLGNNVGPFGSPRAGAGAGKSGLSVRRIHVKRASEVDPSGSRPDRLTPLGHRSVTTVQTQQPPPGRSSLPRQ